MSNYITTLPYISDVEREAREKHSCKHFHLTPWIVQNIVYELIVNHFLTNDPQSMGYVFTQKYSPIKEQSQIYIDNSYNWKADVASKRPAIFISRGDVSLSYPTIGQGIGSHAQDSEQFRFAQQKMPISVIVVASPVGFVEQLADYVKYPLIYFAQEIQRDFCIGQFRLTSIGRPQILVEAKDNFSIELSISTEFNDRWVVRGDDLKLKTVKGTIFDTVFEKPLENQ